MEGKELGEGEIVKKGKYMEMKGDLILGGKYIENDTIEFYHLKPMYFYLPMSLR